MYNKNYKDYSSTEEIYDAGHDLAVKIGEEGEVLLKNANNALPLNKGAKVTPLGYRTQNLFTAGANDNRGDDNKYYGQADVATSLNDAGFKVNPSTLNLYAKHKALGSVVGNELGIDKYTNSVISSYYAYKDAAVITLARSGREGHDLAMYDVDGHADKNEHYLQLEDNEKELIKHAKQYFKKVIVVLNTANVMQIPELAADKGEYAVDAILWVGTVGRSSVEALGRILNGEVNPSGRTSDLWEKDFTKAPYWTNFGSGAQNFVSEGERSNAMYYYDGEMTNFTEVEYREDIYTGYRYYETGFVDYNREEAGKGTKWYDDQVQFAFGYGLGYTTFDWAVVPADAKSKSISKANESVTIRVRVKNTGKVAGKDVVQLYYSAPYTKNGIEKAAANMVAYAKTDLLQPGQSQLVTLKFYAQDMASFDWNDANGNSFKGYELEKGDYELSVRRNSHDVEKTVIRTIAADIKCETDYENSNSITPVFTGDYDSTSKSLLDNKLSRATGMKQPAAPTVADRTLTKEQYDKMNSLRNYYSYEDKTTDDWYVKDGIPASWNQATSHEEDYSDVTVKASELFGKSYSLDLVDHTVVQGTDADTKKWEAFMNQFTWDELCNIVLTGEFISDSDKHLASFVTKAAGLSGANNKDGAIGIGYTKFPGNGLLSATFNDNLSYEMGRMIGNEAIDMGCTTWRAPATNLHRTPFGGRNCEYYSEDPVLSANMTVNAVLGCSEKGVITEVKHCFANEQETYRDMYGGIATLATEQALREIYYKPFDAAIKAGTLGIMTSFNKIGMFYTNSNNFALQETLWRKQSGFIGTVVSDAWTKDWTPINLCVRTGGDNCLGSGNDFQTNNITFGYWDAQNKMVKVPADKEAQDAYENPTHEKPLTEESKALCTLASPTQYYSVRKSAQRVIFTMVNSIMNRNSIPASVEMEVTLLRGVHNSIPLEITQSNDVTFSGEPVYSEGISLKFDQNKGILSGIPQNTGEFTVTGLKATCDGWVNADVNIKINVVSAFEYNGANIERDAVITVAHGEKTGEFVIPYFAYGTHLSCPDYWGTKYGPGTVKYPGGVTWVLLDVYSGPGGDKLVRLEDQMGNKTALDANDPEVKHIDGYRFAITGEAVEGITLEATTAEILGYKGLETYEAPHGFKFVIDANVAPGEYEITVQFISGGVLYDGWFEWWQDNIVKYNETFKIVVT